MDLVYTSQDLDVYVVYVLVVVSAMYLIVQSVMVGGEVLKVVPDGIIHVMVTEYLHNLVMSVCIAVVSLISVSLAATLIQTVVYVPVVV